MADAYDLLLEAAIQHFRELKRRGVRYVAASGDTLARLHSVARAGGHRRMTSIPGFASPRLDIPVSGPPPAPPVSVAPATLVAARSEAPPAAAKLSTQEKLAAFSALRERVLACPKCPPLVAARKSVVFGVGNLDADLMFVGEAPGADEDEQGEPFVGKAGQLLTKIIQAMGLSREQVYIANILKCRPDTPGQSSGNRKPTPEEMQTCILYLHEQIDLVEPKVLVALGATAVEGLLGKTVGIMRLRGTWQTYRGIPLMPTYHPAYLLRNQALSERRRVWEDMLKVMERLGLPISDKQQGYFLKG